MTDKFISILTSKSSAALEATGVVEEVLIIKTGTAAQTATAMAILNGIDKKNWMASDFTEEVNGATTKEIRAPRKYITG